MGTISIVEMVSAGFIFLLAVSWFIEIGHSTCKIKLEILFFMTIVSLLSDSITNIYNNHTANIALYFLNLIDYCMNHVVMIGFLSYCDSYFSEKSKLDHWLFRFPVLILAAFTFIDIAYFMMGKLIIVQNGMFVVSGTIPDFIFICDVIMMFYVPVIAILNRKEIGLKLVLITVSFALPMFLGTMMSYLYDFDIDALTSAVSTTFIPTLLHRELLQSQLESSAQKSALAENSIRMLALEDHFESLYDVELDSGNYEQYIKGRTFGDIMGSLVKESDFYSDTKKNIDVVFEEDRAEVYKVLQPENLRSALEKDNHFDWYYRLVANGNPFWVRMRIVYKDETKKNIIVGVFNADDDVRAHQIEEQKEKLEDALDLAEAANRAKSEFLFNMSHDIRTPLNAITGFTAMAKKYSDDRDRVNDYLEKIDTSSRQLLSLVNNVLEMARIESGQIDLNEEPVNIHQKFNAMITVLSEQSEVHDLKFNCALEGIVHKNVYADETGVNSIMLNISGNAMKYTPEGGTIDFRVKETESQKPGYATFVFTVADTGPGMSKEFMQSIYEPFSREKNSTVSKIQGTGLGMSIVKNYVDLMGGNIEVHSEKGKGTRFDITLDFKIFEGELKTEETENEMHFVDFKGRKALLVEDNELNREITLDILEEEGIEVDEAEDGSVAVKIIKEKGPDYYDFVLMDIQMPVMNGYEATKAIREMYPDSDLPIIAVSANAFEEDRNASKAAGLNEHIAKPINVQNLLEVLERFL